MTSKDIIRTLGHMSEGIVRVPSWRVPAQGLGILNINELTKEYDALASITGSTNSKKFNLLVLKEQFLHCNTFDEIVDWLTTSCTGRYRLICSHTQACIVLESRDEVFFRLKWAHVIDTSNEVI